MPLTVKFWGTRGSLPAPLTAAQVQGKIVRALEATRGQHLPADLAELTTLVETLPFSIRATAGGNTPCVQIVTTGADYVLVDAGTGLRDFAQEYRLAHSRGSHPSFPVGTTFHLFLSHLHWDHLQGLPFFYPLYFAEHRVIIYSGHDQAEAAVRDQFSAPYFPVPYEALKARIEYQRVAAGDVLDAGGLRVRVAAQNHPGGSFGYRFEHEGRSVVYSSDSEHKDPAVSSPDYPLLSFFADADLLIYDAMYSLTDASFNKADWGHSSSVQGVELAARSRVKRLALFHHDPHHDDEELEATLFNARMYAEMYFQEKGRKCLGPHKHPAEILLAYDGLAVEI
jgi:phosphoribosyl 1,2-cyclic phosphodiesterase